MSKANQDCIWTSSKAGLTIQFVAPCDFKNQTLIDSIVNKVVSLLNRRDTSLRILIFISQGQLSFPNAQFSNFFSIGYDTLREIDDDFIFNYYWNEETMSTKQNGGLNTFESQKVPLDINSTNNKTANDIGIKIIYGRDYRLGEPTWADIIKSIVYAANNVELIKNFQTRDTVRYNTNGWYVSLVTLDTTRINEIIGKETVRKATETKASAKNNKPYLIIAGIVLFAVLIFMIARRKHSR